MVSRKKSKRKQKRPSSKRRQKRVLDGGEPITIFIKLLGGETHISKIDPGNTIESIISECREKSPIDEKEFKYVLRFGSNILSDWSKTISYYGIRNESALQLTTKKLPSPFCGLYVFTDYERHNTTNKVLILNDDNTGHLLENPQTGKDKRSYKPPDVVWTYNETNNILRILAHDSVVYFINTSKYFGYYNVMTWITYSSPDNIEQCRKTYEKSYPQFSHPREGFVFRELSTKESKIEFLNTFKPQIHSCSQFTVFGKDYDKLLIRISFDGREFKQILSDLKSSGNMFFFEHIIKVFRYMDKCVLSEVFKFDNPENMKKSIEMMFESLLSRSPDDSCRKELLAIIGRIPEMDIFN